MVTFRDLANAFQINLNEFAEMFGQTRQSLWNYENKSGVPKTKRNVFEVLLRNCSNEKYLRDLVALEEAKKKSDELIEQWIAQQQENEEEQQRPEWQKRMLNAFLGRP